MPMPPTGVGGEEGRTEGTMHQFGILNHAKPLVKTCDSGSRPAVLGSGEDPLDPVYREVPGAADLLDRAVPAVTEIKQPVGVASLALASYRTPAAD